MAKAKTFADKMAKSKMDYTTHCKTCGESIYYIKLITSELADKTKAWRFNQKYVGMCKCNEKEITG